MVPEAVVVAFGTIVCSAVEPPFVDPVTYILTVVPLKAVATAFPTSSFAPPHVNWDCRLSAGSYVRSNASRPPEPKLSVYPVT